MRRSSTRRHVLTTITALAAAVVLFVSAVPAWAMTLTFVRHAESAANADGVIDTSVPGPGITALGQQQAAQVAAVLAGNDYDGIYVSSMLRTQQTAEPLLDLLPEGTAFQVLPGLREISAGIFEGSSERDGLGRLGYALAPVAWTLGLRFVPVLGGEDGNAFDARVDNAIRQIQANGDENAVAFSHGATIMFWVMMNVDNPDLGLLLSHQLANTDTVVVEGSHEDGWTLVNWAGVPVDAQPSLVTRLFVTVRDLVVAPQTFLHDIGRALTPTDAEPEMTADFAPEVTGSDEDEAEDESAALDNAVTLSQRVKRNGATDLTNGNKTVPGAQNSAVKDPSDSAEETAEDDTDSLGTDSSTDTNGDETTEAEAETGTTETDSAPSQAAA
ncbi:histidine phosphatase family protein [Mycolicibacterium sp. XJ1819]